MKKWLKYVKPYLKYFILGPLCMIVEVIGEVLMPLFFARVMNLGSAFQGIGREITAAIDALSAGSAYDGETLMGFVKHLGSDALDGAAALFEKALQAGNTPAALEALESMQSIAADLTAGPYVWQTMGTAVLMVLVALLMMLGGVGGSYFGSKASVNFAADLRRDLFAKVQGFSFASIDKFSTGSLVTRLTNDVTQIQNVVNMMLRMMLRAPGMMIGALIMAISLRPDLSVVLAVVLPLMLVVIVILVITSFPRFSRMQEKMDALNSTVQENITNVRVVKSFVSEDREKEKFRVANRNMKKAGMSAMKLMLFMSPVMTLFMNVTVMVILWFGAGMVQNHGMEIGDLSAFISYVTQILSSLMMVTMMFVMFSRAMASSKRIWAVLDEHTDLTDELSKCKDATVQGGEIVFENVTFRYYKGSEDPVLDRINLKIPAGATVGIIGSTGCGKTTLVSLIPRLYDVDEGRVLVDGIDVRDYSLHHLREGVGMVLQKNVLFSGTIEDNLRWGDEDASMDALLEASTLAQADKFVSTFTEGYHTKLDQGGTNVSGGQKQRLCIARALLKKPGILILDDSTSAVGTATERQIREGLADYLENSTKIIIAQRISSVKDADMIVVMENGRITGVGTHDELMESNEDYKEIFVSQTDGRNS
ncbi:MAG: ABC transporter ATP-binding protein [Clostridia bacterium]|nr:ABC transporter ATP-binding protein [Clostridia bacterium]